MTFPSSLKSGCAPVSKNIFVYRDNVRRKNKLTYADDGEALVNEDGGLTDIAP
jgi:hypothetical protein